MSERMVRVELSCHCVDYRRAQRTAVAELTHCKKHKGRVWVERMTPWREPPKPRGQRKQRWSQDETLPFDPEPPPF